MRCARQADRRVVQDLHGRRRVLGLREHGVDRHVASRLELGEHAVAGEQLAGLTGPVLAEGALHAVHDGAVQPHAHVGIVLAVLRVSQPLVDDAVTADEGLAPIDDDHLAVVAVVQHADVDERPLVKQPDLAASLPHLAHGFLAGVSRAVRVQHHADLLARASALRQRVRDTLAECALLPQEGLEVHRVFRGPDPLHAARRRTRRSPAPRRSSRRRRCSASGLRATGRAGRSAGRSRSARPDRDAAGWTR